MIINISKIQHFSVGDGDGIRTTVFFKGCNLRCPWCHNPENLTSSPCSMAYPGKPGKEILGKYVSPGEILSELLEDKDFYEASGGGITFSGGEVMLQADGAVELGRLLKNEGVSVTVDTAGSIPYTEFEKLSPFVDEYLYDIKTETVRTATVADIMDLENAGDNAAYMYIACHTGEVTDAVIYYQPR